MAMVDGDGSRQRLDVVVLRRLSLGDFCCESYIGPFTEVACSEETKAVTPSTVRRYGRVPGAPPVPYQVGTQFVQHRDPVDLVHMATRKSAFNAQILLQKKSKTARKT